MSLEEVKSIAMNFIESHSEKGLSHEIINYKILNYSFSNLQTRSSVSNAEVVPVYELITETNGQKGYSIVIGDSRIKKVLISVNSGTTNDTLYNKPLRDYFRSIPEMIKRELNGLNIESSARTRMDVISHYAFLPTIWSQGYPYNIKVPYYCSEISDDRAPAGCVPVAIAQVLAFQRVPSNLDWNSILESPIITNNSTQNVIDEVSNLLVEIGNRINIRYDCSGSGISILEYKTKVEQTLSSYGLKYSPYQDFSIDNIIYSLSNSNPIIMNGTYYPAGHAWVCDAYKKHIYEEGVYYEYLNMNWGWGGYSNGFFFVENPPVFQTGTYYWNNIKIISNIRK